MARLFNDGAGTTYDAANARFITNEFGFSNSLTGAKNALGAFEMYNFGSTDVFKQKADNSVAGEMRDCGECHVGGGMMEYVNNTIQPDQYSSGVSYDPAKRTSLRNFVFGSTVTAFNYFIDIFNPDRARRGDAVKNDFAETGVLEMDCLMCHMSGYSWDARKAAVRQGRFDASRVAGAALGSYSSAANGRTVTYDTAMVIEDSDQNLRLSSTAAGRIEATPPANNCAACHQTVHNVDWKKRGELWLAGSEVHYSFGCMSCHKRKDATTTSVGTSGLVSDKRLGQCDPAKGAASPFDAMWNPLDKVQFKECADCHEPSATPTWDTFGAPNSASAHKAAGLTYAIAQDKSGAKVSHLDIIDCTACHVKKSLAVTGGAFVDGSGADEEGRLAVHDNQYVERDMTNGVALHWLNGKLYSANLLTSFFWRDMNGLSPANNGLDANNDTRTAGMDALLQTHVNDINIAAGLDALTADGQVTASEIKEHIAAFNNPTYGLKAQLGISDPNNDKKLLPKLSFLGVPFKTSHNIAPKSEAWGANGCSDCHGPGKGFYNGTYAMNGKMQFFNYSSNQVTIFTKVNGLADLSDFHPNVVNKTGERSVPVQIVNFAQPGQAAVAANIRDIDRSEVLYETTFKKRNLAWYDSNTPIIGSLRPAPGQSGSPWYNAALGAAAGATSTAGWLVKMETWDGASYESDGVTPKIVSRTKQVSADTLTSVDQLIAHLGSFCNSFEYILDAVDTNSDGVNDALRLTAKAGYKVRISPQTDAGPLGFAGNLWIAAPLTGNDGNTYSGRTAWIAYLDNITRESVGLGIAPVAVINTITDADLAKPGTQVMTGTLSLSAADAQTYNGHPVGTTSYSWSFSDGSAELSGQNVTKAISTTGPLTISLKVVDEEGNVSLASTSVEAIAANPISIVYDNAAKIATFAGLPQPNAKLKIVWGDGTTKYLLTGDKPSVDVAKTYATAGSKTIAVYVFDGAGTQIGMKTQTIVVQ